MKKLKVARTIVYQKNYESTARFILNQGGAGSSKSHSLAQLFIYRLFTRKNYKLLITRKTLPALKISAYRLFTDLLKEYGCYDLCKHNKSERTIEYSSNFVHLTGIDDPEKIKSTEWNDVWMEEATDFTLQDYTMLKMRNRAPGHNNQLFISFNPVSCAWIQEEAANEENVEIIISTHRDNPFLNAEAVRVLESLRDENHRKIYLEGQWGVLKGVIFEDFDLIDETPPAMQWTTYGLDFGYTNDPTALIEVSKLGDNIYLNEVLYETGLTNQDIGRRMDEIGIMKNQETIADSAEPKSIEELFREGRNIHGARKGADSIKHGIDLMKRYNLFVTKKSVNLQKELRSYKWAEDKDGNTLNKPVDNFNHAIDAIRYVFLNKLQAKRQFTIA